MYSGTIGSGKSYHALEDVLEALQKGKYVISNFPLKFSERQIKNGLADRFMYLDDVFLMGIKGVKILLQISKEKGWDLSDKEGECLVVIDEATNYFPREDSSKPEQRIWRKFFTQTRKLGFDFILIVQDEQSINRTISKCIEYDVKHRKANNIFPFKLLNIFRITLFFYVTFWKQQRQRLGSSSTIFVKRLAAMYNTKKMFANLDEDLKINLDEVEVPRFGNCGSKDVNGGNPGGGGPVHVVDAAN